MADQEDKNDLLVACENLLGYAAQSFVAHEMAAQGELSSYYKTLNQARKAITEATQETTVELCAQCGQPMRDEDEIVMDGGEPHEWTATDKLFCSTSCESAYHLAKKTSRMKLMAFDSGPKGPIDRYTIIPLDIWTPEDTWALSLSDDCNYANGYSQAITCQIGPHLGKEIPFSELPENVQKHALERLNRD